MPKPLERESSRAKTPGIAEYKLQTEASVVTLRIEKFSLELPKKVEDVLAILEKKAANSLPQEQRLFLAKGTTRSLDVLEQYANLVVKGNVVDDEMIYDRRRYFAGYKMISRAPDGHLDIKLARFLANGALIQLFAEQERPPRLKNLRVKNLRLKNLRGEVSVVCSDKVPLEKAKELLEAFAHALY